MKLLDLVKKSFKYATVCPYKPEDDDACLSRVSKMSPPKQEWLKQKEVMEHANG